ncbi:MAG: ferrochelatase [Simkaniaceae bacterium]|nr:MAG: ferrochelatase [Simkaniaceae bacterium]
MKTGVLLVNLGTPDSPNPGDVKRYLTEFLTDGRVIDLPPVRRNLLVRGVIVPRRYKESAKLYQSIWEEEGSPLLIYGKRVAHLLQERLGSSYQVELAMRYQKPSIEEGLQALKGARRLIIFPLFPQYASATTGSVHQRVFEQISRWEVIPEVRAISSYYDHPSFIEAHIARGKEYDLEAYDHILFSYHGLPERQIKKADQRGTCLVQKDCCKKNPRCYAAQCYGTTEKITQGLKIPKEKWSLAFQSRLGKSPWIRPYSDSVLEMLAKENKKRVLVFSPAFVSDCLETLEEIGCQYKELFIQKGGESLDLVQGLNDHPKWIEAIERIIKN